MDIFYIICMKCRNNHIAYLAEGKGNASNWIFNKSEAYWFETEKEAREYANIYFKNFKDWFIEELTYGGKDLY